MRKIPQITETETQLFPTDFLCQQKIYEQNQKLESEN